MFSLKTITNSKMIWPKTFNFKVSKYKPLDILFILDPAGHAQLIPESISHDARFALNPTSFVNATAAEV